MISGNSHAKANMLERPGMSAFLQGIWLPGAQSAMRCPHVADYCICVFALPIKCPQPQQSPPILKQYRRLKCGANLAFPGLPAGCFLGVRVMLTLAERAHDYKTKQKCGSQMGSSFSNRGLVFYDLPAQLFHGVLLTLTERAQHNKTKQSSGLLMPGSYLARRAGLLRPAGRARLGHAAAGAAVLHPAALRAAALLLHVLLRGRPPILRCGYIQRPLPPLRLLSVISHRQ
jgi:hypothetical protein